MRPVPVYTSTSQSFLQVKSATFATRTRQPGLPPLLCILGLLALGPHIAQALVIDDFDGSTLAAAHAVPSTGPAVAVGSGPGILGGERDLLMHSGTESSGPSTISWDGSDGDAALLDHTGLGGVDLTAEGHDAVLLRVTRNDRPVRLSIRIHTDKSNSSTARLSLPGRVSTVMDIIVPFSAFTTSAGMGADFSSVGAIEITVDSGRDLAFGAFQTTSATPVIEATKTDTPAGPVSPGDQIKYTIVIRNTGDMESTGVGFEDTVDENTDFISGSVETTPLARDDAYDTFVNTPLSVPSGPGDLLDNDFPGIPTAALTSFGGGDLGGVVTDHAPGDTIPVGGAGSLTVNADGSFDFRPDTGVSGPFSFEYRITNPLGVSDALVTIDILPSGQQPVAVDDTVAPGSAPGDAYHTALNTPLNIPDGPDDLLENDTLGVPPATLTFFGGGDLGGVVTDNAAGATAPVGGAGSLIVNADGSLSFTPDTDFTGLFSFEYRIENAAGSDDATVTLAVGIRPATNPDDLVAIGNVQIDSSAIPLSVLDNDDGDLVSVTAMDATSANNGEVVDLGGGEFTYDPPPGFEGNDTFNYTMENGFGSVPGTVTISVAGMIWFINNDPGAPPGNDGRLTSPFNALADFEAVNGGGGANDPEAGDNIFVYETASGDYTGGVTLENGQLLVGDGSSSDLATITGLAVPQGSSLPSFSGNDPTIANATGNGIILAQGNAIRGLTVGDTPNGFGISGGAVGTFDILEVSIAGTGGAVEISSSGAAGTVAFEDIASDSAPARGINLNSVSGAFTVGGSTTINNPDGAGIQVQNSGSGSFDFGVTSVSGAGQVAGAGIDLATNNGGASFDFEDLSITTNNGAGLVASNSGTINNIPTSNDITISTTGGPAVDIESTTGQTNGVSGWTFASLSSTGSGSDGVRLTDLGDDVLVSGVDIDATAGAGIAITSNGGAITVSGGTIGTPTTTTGAAVDIDQGNGNVAIAADIGNSSGRSVEVTGRTGGTVTISGNITDTGTGILVDSNSGGTTTLSGASKVLSTGAVTAVTLTNNAGHTINLTGGGLDIDTSGSATAFNANGGATALSVTGSGNSINTTAGTGMALNVDGANISAAGLNFERIDIDGAPRGIVLLNTGATGGLTVTGVGSTDGSGGTIQNITNRGASIINAANISLRNMNFIDAATSNGGGCTALSNSGCNAAIHLSTVSGVTLNNVTIDGSAQEGINGLDVADLSLSACEVLNAGDEVNEACVRLVNLSGTSSISGSDFAFPAERAVSILNSTGTLELTIDGSTFRDTQSSGLGADGLEVRSDGNANTTIDITNSSFLRNRTNGLQVFSEDNSVVDVDVTGSTFDREAGIGIGIDLAAADNGDMVFNVIGNPLITSRGSNAVNVFVDDTASMMGRINDNPNIQCGGPSTSGTGIRVQVNTNSTGIFEINGNTVSNIGFDAGIQVISRLKTGGTDGRVDATIDGNTVTVDPLGLYDIWVQANDLNTTCANVTNNSASGNGIAAFRVRESGGSSSVLLEGFSANAATTWTNNGNIGSPVSESPAGAASAGTCATPTHPLP